MFPCWQTEFELHLFFVNFTTLALMHFFKTLISFTKHWYNLTEILSYNESSEWLLFYAIQTFLFPQLYNGENKFLMRWRWLWCPLTTRPTRLVCLLFYSNLRGFFLNNICSHIMCHFFLHVIISHSITRIDKFSILNKYSEFVMMVLHSPILTAPFTQQSRMDSTPSMYIQ